MKFGLYNLIFGVKGVDVLATDKTLMIIIGFIRLAGEDLNNVLRYRLLLSLNEFKVHLNVDNDLIGTIFYL